MKSTIYRLIPVAILGFMACGCAEKLTYERFQTIQTGDSPRVVESTLGKPTIRGIGDQTWVYQDYDRCINAVVYFHEAKVSDKKWSDMQRGIEGKPSVSQPGESREVHVREIK
jgi:hypothetical protein